MPHIFLGIMMVVREMHVTRRLTYSSVEAFPLSELSEPFPIVPPINFNIDTLHTVSVLYM